MLRIRADRGAVDPLAAALFVFLGEHGDRARLAAACPPVHHLSILSRRPMGEQHCRRGKDYHAVTCHRLLPLRIFWDIDVRPSNESRILSSGGRGWTMLGPVIILGLV